MKSNLVEGPIEIPAIIRNTHVRTDHCVWYVASGT